MLVLNPGTVSFNGTSWDDVTVVAIDRDGERVVREWGDFGPHAVLADVPEQSVGVRVVRRLARDDIDGPRPGDMGELVFFTSPSGADLGRRRVRATCVVTRVRHELGGREGATREVRFAAVSSDGAADPVSIEAADGMA